MHVTITSLQNGITEIPNALEIIAPTQEGIIGILPGHAPLLSALGSGVLLVRSQKEPTALAISGWVIETDGKSVKILSDIAESNHEDLSAIRERMQEARNAMERAKSEWDTVSMERFIEIEQEYQKDTAREQLAMGNHRI